MKSPWKQHGMNMRLNSDSKNRHLFEVAMGIAWDENEAEQSAQWDHEPSGGDFGYCTNFQFQVVHVMVLTWQL